jgi:hypothetical protein
MLYADGFIFKRMPARCFPVGLLRDFPILPHIFLSACRQAGINPLKL